LLTVRTRIESLPEQHFQNREKRLGHIFTVIDFDVE